MFNVKTHQHSALHQLIRKRIEHFSKIADPVIFFLAK